MGDLAADRYALLVEQMGQEKGFARGWMTTVAERLGVHRSYVSRIHAGDRSGIGRQSIERAIERVPLLPAFFYEEMAQTPLFRDYLAREGSVIEVADAGVLERFGNGNHMWGALAARCGLYWRSLVPDPAAAIPPEKMTFDQDTEEVLIELALAVRNAPLYRHAMRLYAWAGLKEDAIDALPKEDGLFMAILAVELADGKELMLKSSDLMEARERDFAPYYMKDHLVHLALSLDDSVDFTTSHLRGLMPVFFHTDKLDHKSFRWVSRSLSEQVLLFPVFKCANDVLLARKQGDALDLKMFLSLMFCVREVARWTYAARNNAAPAQPLAGPLRTTSDILEHLGRAPVRD